jgi:hypothetical protein
MLDGHRQTTDEEAELYCREYIPDIAGTYSGVCVIVGSGGGMWEDYAKIKDEGFDIMGVNVGGQFIPSLTHLFSWHCQQISAISKFRKAEFHGKEFLTHSVRAYDGIDYVWYLSGGASMSGISAIDLCWLLGYRKIILCGVPMDDSGYFYGRAKNPEVCDKYRQEEVLRLKQKFGDNVKSLSGYTKEIYGSPTREWLSAKT